MSEQPYGDSDMGEVTRVNTMLFEYLRKQSALLSLPGWKAPKLTRRQRVRRWVLRYAWHKPWQSIHDLSERCGAYCHEDW